MSFGFLLEVFGGCSGFLLVGLRGVFGGSSGVPYGCMYGLWGFTNGLRVMGRGSSVGSGIALGFYLVCMVCLLVYALCAGSFEFLFLIVLRTCSIDRVMYIGFL